MVDKHSKSEINISYDIPQAFYEYIESYIRDDDPVIILDPPELVRLYQTALQYRTEYPQCQDAIAEWAAMAGRRSPLNKEHKLFEDLYDCFLSLEVEPYDTPSPYAETTKEGWQIVERLVDEAAVQFTPTP